MAKLGEISEVRLNDDVVALAELGVKYAGTPGEMEARDYLLERLEELGLGVPWLEEFEYLNYMPIRGKLELKGPFRKSMVCEPLQCSANAEAEGKLVYGGKSEEDLEELGDGKQSIEGKIVLTESSFPFLVYPLAEKLGAAGVVVITDPPGDLVRVGLAVPDRRKGTIPGVTVSKGAGQYLKKVLESEGVGLRMRSEGIYSKKKSWNIIHRMPGSGLRDEKIGVCSHYDSQIKGQHAWDNVTGDVGVLEIARSLGSLGLKRTVEVVFFGAEEQGFWGSTSFVKNHEREIMENYRALVNLDGFSSSLCSENYLETLMPLSDHIPFLEAGVPIIWIHEGLIDPYYHTEGDTHDHIDPKKMKRITQVASRCVYELASTNELPPRSKNV